MIRVRRTGAVPIELSGEQSAGSVERQKAIAYYADPANKEKAFESYSAYKSPGVKQALHALFKGKCAYCEMDYGGAPLDVEHFRPKSGTVEVDPATFRPRTKPRPKQVKPGYYWLAADWTNLLPSCIDCNRQRTHTTKGRGSSLSGKGNYFPLAPGSARATNPAVDCETAEQRLLLDPCRDEPHRHLEFGRQGVICAKRTDAGDDVRGRASIEIYGLQRDDLVRQREITQKGLRLRLAQLLRAQRALVEDPGNTFARRLFLSTMEEIRTEYLAPDRRFQALCRQVVLKSFARNALELAAGGDAQPAAETAPLVEVPG